MYYDNLKAKQSPDGSFNAPKPNKPDLSPKVYKGASAAKMLNSPGLGNVVGGITLKVRIPMPNASNVNSNQLRPQDTSPTFSYDKKFGDKIKLPQYGDMLGLPPEVRASYQSKLVGKTSDWD
jgi:hypothetical protein